MRAKALNRLELDLIGETFEDFMCEIEFCLWIVLIVAPIDASFDAYIFEQIVSFLFAFEANSWLFITLFTITYKIYKIHNNLRLNSIWISLQKWAKREIKSNCVSRVSY